LDVRRSDALNPQRKKTGINGKRGTLWEIRARKIKKKVRNRTPKNNIRRTKRRRTSNRKEPLDFACGFSKKIKFLKIPRCLESLFFKLNLVCAEQDVVCSDGLAAHRTPHYTTWNHAQELALKVFHFSLRFLYGGIIAWR
jgi:hypothetical protein